MEILISYGNNIFAQCGTGTSYGSISPTGSWQNTSSVGSGQMPYWSFSGISGATYSFSSCNGTAEDTYIRVYNSSWVEQASNDDNGIYCTGTQASLDWVCSASGTYYVFLSHYSCTSLSNNQILSHKCVTPEWVVPSSGNNSYTLTCGSAQHLYDYGGSGGNYDINWDGYTVIYPSGAGYKIQISGITSGEACCDYIQVYNGVGTGGTLLGTYYMNTAIPTLTSTDAGGALTIRFYSDVSITGTGFDISINCFYPCVPAGNQVTYGSGSWIGYSYSWTGVPAFTTYLGYVTESETFDRDIGTGNISGATTNLCYTPADNFSVKYKMNKSFTDGYYIFTIGGDDGVRLSTDGGSTFFINGWADQGYTTYNNSASPLHLNGSTNLDFQYYENAGGARASFSYCTVPFPAGSITGTSNVCVNSSGIAYSVPAVAGATSYTWTYSGTGFSIASGSGTNSITANFSSATTGNLTVTPVNACGSGTVSSNYAITITSSLPPAMNAGEDIYICSGTSIVSLAATGSGTWTQISGPNNPNIVNASSPTTQIGTTTGLISGTYVFRWSTSNACGVSYDDVVIIKQ